MFVQKCDFLPASVKAKRALVNILALCESMYLTAFAICNPFINIFTILQSGWYHNFVQKTIYKKFFAGYVFFKKSRIDVLKLMWGH